MQSPCLGRRNRTLCTGFWTEAEAGHPLQQEEMQSIEIQLHEIFLDAWGNCFLSLENFPQNQFKHLLNGSAGAGGFVLPAKQ